MGKEKTRAIDTVRRLVHLGLNAAGYDIHKTASIGRDMGGTLSQVRRLGFEPSTVIDVGVAYGTPPLYVAFPRAFHLLIEPLAEWEPTLRELADRHRGAYVLAAAGRRSGRTTINIHADASSSSQLCEADGPAVDGTPRTVPVVTLDEVCLEQRLSGPYVVKVDVQGAELEVLEGATNVLRETQLVLLECSLFQFYEHGPQVSDIVGWMKESGYAIYDVCGGHCRPYDGALAQIDLAFVREDGPFRRHHGYAAVPGGPGGPGRDVDLLS